MQGREADVAVWWARVSTVHGEENALSKMSVHSA
jgi:hypothetical protein